MTSRNLRISVIIATMAAAASSTAFAARIPEPDIVLHGTLHVDFYDSRNQLVTGASGRTVTATINGIVVATYRMGAYPALGDTYILHVPLETRTAGESERPDCAYAGSLVQFWVDDIPLAQSYTVPSPLSSARGKVFAQNMATEGGTIVRPDLTIRDFAVLTGEIYPGEGLRVSGQVVNTATSTAPEAYSPKCSLRFLMSTAPDFAISHILTTAAGTIAEAGFAPGDTVPFDNGSVATGLDVPPGTYYVGAVVDRENTIVETDETNNVAVAPTQVVVCRRWTRATAWPLYD